MNLRFIISALILLAISFYSNAQQADTIFYDAQWKKASRANSSFYRILKKKDDGKFNVVDYFKTGEVQMTGTYSALDPDVEEGEFIWYYQNGKKEKVTDYKEGKVVTTMSWDENGVDRISDGKIDVAPEFPGGMKEFYKYIGANFNYPKGFNPRPVGTMQLSFVINKDGSIVDIKVERSVHEKLDEEAIRVLKSMPRWRPGSQKGQLVRVKYNIPLNMK